MLGEILYKYIPFFAPKFDCFILDAYATRYNFSTVLFTINIFMFEPSYFTKISGSGLLILLQILSFNSHSSY